MSDLKLQKEVEGIGPGFHRLNATQFLGALNDNILKLFIVFFLVGMRGGAEAGKIAATATLVFVIPFLIFSGAAGVIADMVSKTRIVVFVKGVEVAVTLLAAISFMLGNEIFLYISLFLMGSHSAFFAPAKYGIVPELVRREELSRANGLLEMLSYTAIVLGAAIAPFAAQLAGGNYSVAVITCVLIAVTGFLVSRKIPFIPSAAEGKKFSLFIVNDIVCSLKLIKSDGYLLLAVIGSAYFMYLGAFAQMTLLPYGMQVLGLTQEQSGYLFLAAAIGIGVGSLLAGRLSGRNVEFGVVPIGTLGLSLAALALAVAKSSLFLVLPITLFFGLSAGLFIVPLQAFIQLRAPKECRGEVMAASIFLGWVGVLLASGTIWFLDAVFHLSATAHFLFIGILTLVLSIWALIILPDFLLRFFALVAMRLLYRLRIIGAENVPIEGAALLVPNHVSWLDALLLMATQQRRVRFVIDRSIYNFPLLNPAFRIMRLIPVSSRDSRKQVAEFFAETRKVLDEGYLLCIFAEGAVTRNGMLREFRPGFERIVKGTDYPIIPAYIGGAWGSILSYAHGKLLNRLPSLLPYEISIHFGAPMPAASKAAEVRERVMELSCDYFDSRKFSRKPISHVFIISARENWRRKAVTDSTGKKLTYGQLLVGSIVLSERIRPKVDGERVGVLLPPTVGGVVTNIALPLAGLVPVNLNYTASPEGILSAISQSGITHVITSRAFLSKMEHLPRTENMLFLEEIAANVTWREKARAWIRGRFFPARLLLKAPSFSADDTATIIFSSGSSGEPKGVMLSHHNIQSNVEALRMVFRVTPEDNICSALPLFHSLGFTGTLWLPLLSGFSASYHPNPLDAGAIAELARSNRSTLLLTTPTFLLGYIRKAKKEDFAALRIVITGAEKLPPRIADAFEEKFGERPLEGYGATELSPVITLSLPEVDVDGVRHIGAKEGSVGHPIPGVVVKVVDPETSETMPPGKSGLILVRGPNVMVGYINNPQKTSEVIRDGWYVTGDIGHLDDEGFLHITDRLSRFSKIGGEMVPHGVVEEEIHRLLDKNSVVAVTSLPDEKRGEKIVVLCTADAGDVDELHRQLVASSMPNLWKPGRDCLVQVPALPLLGSGKLDLKRLKEMAENAMSPR